MLQRNGFVLDLMNSEADQPTSFPSESQELALKQAERRLGKSGRVRSSYDSHRLS